MLLPVNLGEKVSSVMKNEECGPETRTLAVMLLQFGLEQVRYPFPVAQAGILVLNCFSPVFHLETVMLSPSGVIGQTVELRPELGRRHLPFRIGLRHRKGLLKLLTAVLACVGPGNLRVNSLRIPVNIALSAIIGTPVWGKAVYIGFRLDNVGLGEILGAPAPGTSVLHFFLPGHQASLQGVNNNWQATCMVLRSNVSSAVPSVLLLLSACSTFVLEHLRSRSAGCMVLVSTGRCWLHRSISR